jgi:histidine triad (HIT) family protein
VASEVTDVPECIFCRIASGEVASQIVHEDDQVVAFRDINAQAPTHVLVIPRKHVVSVEMLGPGDDALVGKMLRVCAKIAQEEKLTGRGFRVVANSGREAGQSVDHLHFHLLGGRPMGWPPG